MERSDASSRVVYAADVGSTRTDGKRRAGSGFGWARLGKDGEVEGCASIVDLATAVAADLAAGCSVALGFEAPLAIPVPTEAPDLCRGRAGEGSRSFAAPAGLAVATLGVHQAAWVLARVRSLLGPDASNVRFSQAGADWQRGERTLICWEAFVSGAAHSADHIRDAATAVVAFAAAEADLDTASAVHAARPLSLIGAAALWSGWLADPACLHAEPVVIKPATPFTGPIRLLRIGDVRAGA